MKLDYTIYSTDKETSHSYMESYENIFAKYENVPISLLEIGVETGGSLKMWKDFFIEGSSIAGIDNWSTVRLVGERVALRADNVIGCDVYEGDATKFQLDKKFDIIIDDGSHILEDVILTFKNFWENLREDGIYVVEDVPGDDLSKWEHQIKQRLKVDYEIVDCRPIGTSNDDILIIFKKGKEQIKTLRHQFSVPNFLEL